MNKLEVNELYDIYGELLTSRQQEILQLYFQEDLSYAEISEELSISRAAVLDAVHKGTKALEKYENCVNYIKNRNKVLSLVKEDKALFEKIQEIL